MYTETRDIHNMIKTIKDYFIFYHEYRVVEIEHHLNVEHKPRVFYNIARRTWLFNKLPLWWAVEWNIARFALLHFNRVLPGYQSESRAKVALKNQLDCERYRREKIKIKFLNQ